MATTQGKIFRFSVGSFLRAHLCSRQPNQSNTQTKNLVRWFAPISDI